MVGIDFGIAFGDGVNLTLPELMPFRLTKNILGVMKPIGVNGEFRQSMIYGLTALQKKRDSILDCCEVFIKDPILEWLKKNRRSKYASNMAVFDSFKSNEKGGNSIQQVSGSQSSASMEKKKVGSRKLDSYPKIKIDIVRQKLLGYNSGKIMMEELKQSKHNKAPFIDFVTRIVLKENTLRGSKEETFSVPQQVDCLIEHAMDPSILSRVWLGWSPCT